ncbi:hypothetical protein [Fodinibius roseus]|uniref:hypothetical protein n=1 Tax=Fodinibius roseus TaxID=1194090 RepID=UPI001FCCC57F|nr:hypothetical protein [Fodinibius roseus]
MKRLITLLVLLGLSFSSCDSPVSDLSSDPQSSSDAVDIISQIPSGTPPAKADSIRKAIWKQFKEQHGSEWSIRWSKDTDLPAAGFRLFRTDQGNLSRQVPTSGPVFFNPIRGVVWDIGYKPTGLY